MADKSKLLTTVVSIAGEISPTLGKSIKELEKKFEGVNVQALAVGASIGAIAVGTGAAVVGATKYLAKLGDSYNSAVNDISAGTGLVGQELEGMSDVLKDVYGSNFGESMEDAAAGVSEVYKATKLTGDELAATTKGAYALADTFGYDVAESARAAKAMMTNFGVSGEEAMGLIAAGAQNGLDYSGELIDSINEYSVQFAKLGFSADDMFNIFQQGADSGAWNLDKVGDAVKEFSIRSIDGSKTTTEAFEALGLNANEMMATFAAGGDDASIAFQGVLGALTAMDDEVQRDAIGVKLFGTQWEDLGTEAKAALADINDEAYNTGDALGKINDVKYDNLGSAFEGIKRQAEVALLPLASTIANALTDLAPVISDLFTQIGPLITQATEMAMPFITEFLDGIYALLPEITPYIMDFANQILPILGEFVGQLLPPLLSLIKNLLPPLMSIISSILPVVTDLLLQILPMAFQICDMILPLIVNLIDQLVPVVMPLLDICMMLLRDAILPLLPPLIQIIHSLIPPLITIIQALMPPIQYLAYLFTNLLGSAIQMIMPYIQHLIGYFSNLIDFISNIFTGNWSAAWENVKNIFSHAFGALAELVKMPINAVIGIINSVIGAINSVGFKIPDWVPVVGGKGFTIDIPKIPMLATGGFTDGVSIAGEEAMEAVISFDPAYRKENLAYWAQAGRMLGADTSDYSLESSASGSSVVIEGVTFAPNITVTGNADIHTIMEAIEAEYPEFIDFLEEYLMQRGVTVYA